MGLFLVATLALALQDDDRRIDALIAQLDADAVEERKRAQAELLGVGERALPRLRAALPKASGEQKARLEETVRELEFRVEEAALRKEGLPPRIARLVPRFRERFLSADETLVLGALGELYGYRHGVPDEPKHWSFEKARFDDVTLGVPVLRSALDRAKGTELKRTALFLAGSTTLLGLEDSVARHADDAEFMVRWDILRLAGSRRLPGAETGVARFLESKAQEERSMAVRALREMKTPKANDLLVTALDDPSARIRQEGCQAVAWNDVAAATPALRRRLKDPDGHVRSTAVWALMTLRVADAVEDVLSLKGDPDPNVRAAMIRFISTLKEPRGKEAVLEALKRGEGDPALEAAIEAAASLGLREALPRLLELLRAGNAKAARAISDLGPGPVEKDLLGLLRSEDASLRTRAVQALSGGPSPEAAKALIGILADGDRAVAQAAAAALARARGKEVDEALRAALRDASLRGTVLEALADSGDGARAALAVELLDDSNPEVARRALRVVERHRVPDALPKVLTLLAHSSDDVASGAASALYRLAGPEATPALLRVLDGAPPKTRRRIWNFLALDPGEEAAKAAAERFGKAETEEQRYMLDVFSRVRSETSTAFLLRLMGEEASHWRPLAVMGLARRGHPRALEALRGQLKTGSANERASAAMLLAENGELGGEGVKALVDAAARAERGMSRAYLRPLAEAVRPEAQPLLLEGLRADGWWERNDMGRWMALYPAETFDEELRKRVAGELADRRGVARALSHVEVPDRLDLLARLAGDESAEVRKEAMLTYRELRPSPAPKGLLARLEDPVPEVRAWAVDAVGRSDPAALEARLGALLSDDSPAVREKAAWAAGNAKVAAAAPALPKLLSDEAPGVRSAAAFAAGTLGLRGSADRLVALARDDGSAWTRYYAALALIELGHERGLESMRSQLGRVPPMTEGWVLLQLLRRRDRSVVPRALSFAAASSSTFSEGNRVLLALNAFAEPDLYARAVKTPLDLRRWKGTERGLYARLGGSLGVPFEVDPRLPDRPLEGRSHDGSEGTVEDEMHRAGFYLEAACLLERDRVRVVPRLEALAHWRRWWAEQPR